MTRVWVSFEPDWSEFVVWGSEVDALRFAVGHSLRVAELPVGVPVKAYLADPGRFDAAIAEDEGRRGAGVCKHPRAVRISTMGGSRQLLCPDCDEVVEVSGE